MADLDEAQGKSRPRREIEAAHRQAEAIRTFADQRHPFWPAEATVLAALVLDLGLPKALTIGPRWLLPVFEGVLLVGLVIASPQPKFKHSTLRRQVPMALIGLVSAVNLYSLIQLVHYLLRGGKVGGGHALILAGAVLGGRTCSSSASGTGSSTAEARCGG